MRNRIWFVVSISAKHRGILPDLHTLKEDSKGLGSLFRESALITSTWLEKLWQGLPCDTPARICLARTVNAVESRASEILKNAPLRTKMPHAPRDNIYIFCWGSNGDEYNLSLRMSGQVTHVVEDPPKFSLFEILRKDFSKFLCMRINLAPRAVRNRLVHWCGSDCCDSQTMKVLSFLQRICSGGGKAWNRF